MTYPITIFYVYAETDETLRQQLEQHLALLRRQGVIAEWQKISAGASWAEKTERAFEKAELILLLISADFLASDMCYGQQMQQILERERQGEVKVIPVLLRPVNWEAAPFAHLQVLPTNGKAITSWSNQDEAFLEVMKGIGGYLSQGLPSSKLRQPNNKLRAARLQRGWSHADLAEKMNIDKKTILRWESGKASPTTYGRQRLSEVLGKDAHELGLTFLPQEHSGSSPLQEQSTSFMRQQTVLYAVSRTPSKGKSAYHQNLGKVHLIFGRYEHALLTYEKALHHEPHNTTLLLGKGEALLRLERSQEALVVYEHVLLLDPASSTAYQGRGRAYELVAQQVFEAMKREAQDCFEKAKQLDPHLKKIDGIADNG